MTEETYIREKLEIERLRDSFVRLDRINNTEKDIAVLKTVMEHIREKIANAVSDDDLKQLSRELEAEMRTAIEGINRSNEKLGDQLARLEASIGADKTASREQIIADLRAIVGSSSENKSRWLWWVLGIVGSLIVTFAGSLFAVWLALSIRH